LDCERLLGAEHPDTLRARSARAACAGRAGDLAAAADLFCDIAADRQRILGAGHPDTLRSRQQHARYLGEAGDGAAARDLGAAVASDCAQLLGVDHPDTLESRHMHAYYLGASGDPAGARDRYSALAHDRERTPDKAAALAAQSFDHAHRALGPEDPVTRASLEHFVALAAARDAAHLVVLGHGRSLTSAAVIAVRIDAGAATTLLSAWSDATTRLDAPPMRAAIATVIKLAADHGRTTELAAAVVRALPGAADERRSRWVAEWLDASAAYDELAIARRMLRAASAALDGDSTALLYLPAEEQRVVEADLGDVARAGVHVADDKAPLCSRAG